MINTPKMESMVKLMILFCSKNYVSVKDICDKLGVTQRTAYRYLNDLSASIPIYKSQIHKTKYTISRGFRLPASLLTDEEISTIIEILSEVNKQINSDKYTTIIEKLQSIGKKENIGINLGNLIIDTAGWGTESSTNYTLSLIQDCIEHKKVMYVEYTDRDGKQTERMIEPHTILLKKDTWYCYAYCQLDSDMRLFKVSRFTKCEVTEKLFNRKNCSNLSDILKSWYTSLDTEDAEFEFDKSIKGDIEEWLGMNDIYVNSDGRYRVIAKLPINTELVNKVMSFGNKIKVIEPKSLINGIKEKIDEINKIYN